jgi:hypothetical protein
MAAAPGGKKVPSVGELHKAIKEANVERVEKLVARGVDVNGVDPKTNLTALYVAHIFWIL